MEDDVDVEEAACVSLCSPPLYASFCCIRFVGMPLVFGCELVESFNADGALCMTSVPERSWVVDEDEDEDDDDVIFV